MAELTALARAKRGSLSFASVGNGSPGHLARELQALRTGVKRTHIPYCGGGPAVTDVMGGQVLTLWVSIPAAAPFVKAGKLLAQGAEAVGGTPEALGAVVAAELPRWAKLARDANIKAE